MNEKFLILERSIQHDLEAIDRLYSSIGERRHVDCTVKAAHHANRS